MTDAINPKHYQFPGGAQTIDITQHLTGNGAQAAEYVIRSTRLDGCNKHDTVEGQIEDLNKAVWFIKSEIARLGAQTDPMREAYKKIAKDLGARVWDRIEDVPTGVVVSDGSMHWIRTTETETLSKDFSNTDPVWTIHHHTDYDPNEYGPFTEVNNVH